MSQNVYRVLTIPKEPFVIFNEKKQEYSGLLIDILKEVAHTLNFTYKIAIEDEREYGYQSNEGTWNGIIGQLAAGKADIGLAALSLTSERMRVVDFTDPIFPSTGISILTQKPLVQTEPFRFFTVMDIRVWLCITASYVFTSTLLWSFDLFSPHSYRNRRKLKPKKADEGPEGSVEAAVATAAVSTAAVAAAPEGENKKASKELRIFGLKESLWFCLTSLTPEGGGEAPRNYSGRLISTTWWLFGFIIIASYTANLAAILTLSRFDRTVDNFDDLIAHYKYTYTAVRNSEVSRYFERRKGIEFKLYDAWKALTLNDNLTPYEKAQLAVWEYPLGDRYNKINAAISYQNYVKDLTEAIGKFDTKDSRFALITETTDVQFQVMTNCTFKEIGPEFSKKPYAIALRKDAPLNEKFNDVIRDLINKRWLKRTKEKWWDKNPKRKSCYNMDEKSEGLLIENIGGLFITTFFGIVISIGTLIFEFIYLKLCDKPVKKVIKQCKKKMKKKRDRNKEVVNHIKVKS